MNSKIAVGLVHRFEMESMALHPVQREWLEREITTLTDVTDEQLGEAVLQFARSRGPSINLTYEDGRYSITTPTGAAMNLARAIRDLLENQP